MDGSESCATEMDFPMLSYFCFIEFHWSEEFSPESADQKQLNQHMSVCCVHGNYQLGNKWDVKLM